MTRPAACRRTETCTLLGTNGVDVCGLADRCGRFAPRAADVLAGIAAEEARRALEGHETVSEARAVIRGAYIAAVRLHHDEFVEIGLVWSRWAIFASALTDEELRKMDQRCSGGSCCRGGS